MVCFAQTLLALRLRFVFVHRIGSRQKQFCAPYLLGGAVVPSSQLLSDLNFSGARSLTKIKDTCPG